MAEEEKNKILQLCDIKGKIVLDVGCGNGRYSDLFSEYCKKYIGIDVDEHQIDINKNNNNKNNVIFETSNIVMYNPKEKFDIIILSLTFHEIDIREQGLAIQNMLDLLNDNGKIIILEPALKDDSFQALWNIAYDSIKFYNHDYSVKHSQDVIEKVAKNSLCKIIKKDYLEIPFEFNNLDEILDMIINDIDFKYVKWNDTKKEKLYGKLDQFVQTNEKITICDKLDITVIEK